MSKEAERIARFRVLHERPGAFVIPNPFDVGSARLLAHLGFEALATTSSGFAWTLGKPDGATSRAEALSHMRAIVEATDLPVNADLEHCYADAPEGVAETIWLAADIGLAGASIEDASGDRAQPIYDFNLAVERVAAGIEAARTAAVPMLITARAENLLHGRNDLDDTIRRLQAFEAAGANVLYAPGLKTLEEIRLVTSSVSKPVNVLMGGHNPDLTLADLAAAGAKRISVGGALARAAWAGVLAAAREMRDAGTFTFTRTAASGAELNRIFKTWGTTT